MISSSHEDYRFCITEKITAEWEEGHTYDGEFDGLMTGEGVLVKGNHYHI